MKYISWISLTAQPKKYMRLIYYPPPSTTELRTVDIFLGSNGLASLSLSHSVLSPPVAS